MRRLEGLTALVVGGGSRLGRAAALALSARGVAIMVTGSSEKELGITVGEVVHGGGKARHLAGDADDRSHLRAAFDRTVEVFGRVDVIVDVGGKDVEYILGELTRRLSVPGRVLLLGPAAGAPGGARLVHAAADAERERGITCNGVVADTESDEVADDAAELVVFLCTRAAAGITGQLITVGHAARTPAGA